jgi:polyferredoxin
MKTLLFLFILLAPNLALADGGALWMKQTSGVQWWFIIITILAVLLLYKSVQFAVSKMSNIDLLDYWQIRTFMKSRWYPAVFQIPALFVFAAIFYYLFFGSYYYSENPASIMVWTFWWALLPFSFILLGRFWCAVCPFAWISDFVQKHFGRQRKVPLFLAKYSFWIVDIIFILITWYDRVYGMTEKPFMSGVIFLGLFFGAVICGILYERRVFCRYVCFLGNVAGTYSMVAPIELTSKDPAKCADCKIKACYFGRKKESGEFQAGCPFYQIIPGKQGNRFCTFCANCVKACPQDNIALSIRPFGAELWKRLFVRFEESFFAKMLVGIVIIQNIGMTTLWSLLENLIINLTGITNDTVLFTIIFLLTISIPLVLMFAASVISAKASKEKVIQNFARFGYAFVAIDLAGHLAHNLNHFFGEGKTILAAFFGLFSGNVQQQISVWILNFDTVKVLQYLILGLGAVATFYITYKIAGKKAATKSEMIKILLPHAILLTLLIILNFYIFSLPMSHRS